MPFVPTIVRTIRGYDRRQLRGDAIAGLTTAVMLVPQGMAYAMLAGLPPIYGLYAALVPLAIYAMFGTSRQLAVGPVAMVSLLVAAGVSTIAPIGSEAFVGYALLLALMVGALQLAMGVLRLGFVVNFLSHPVISGFTSAAALIIGFSQLKHLLGYAVPRSHHVHTIVVAAWAARDQVHLPTLALGVGAVVVLLLLAKYAPAVPRALVVVGGGALLVWGLDLHERGVAVVGAVPAGLPPLTVPRLDLAALGQLGGVAAVIATVGFMESIAVAKKYARDDGYEVDANKELTALGLANVAGAFFGSYPVTGGFSRTAVNAQAGARSNIAGLITAAIVALSLLFLTPLFYYLPRAVLAAIIVTAVLGLVDVKEIRHLWKVKRSDLGMLVLTFGTTLMIGIEQGIAAGVVASLVVMVLQTTRPHVAVLGRLPGSNDYRNVTRFAEAEPTPGILTLRLDAQLYFGNVNFLKETLDALEAEHQQRHGAVAAVVIDASGINQIDASGETAFCDIHAAYAARGIALHLANVKGPVRDVFARSGFTERLGPDAFHLNVHAAVTRARAHASNDETNEEEPSHGHDSRQLPSSDPHPDLRRLRPVDA